MKTNPAAASDACRDVANGVATTIRTDLINTEEPFKSLFPIREDVLERITEDMKQNGFDYAQPIILWAGHHFTVINGHIRLMAARKLGISMIPVVIHEFETESEAIEYAIKSQRNRRNLTDAELMYCITVLDRRREPGFIYGGSPRIHTSGYIGSILGTSRTKVEEVRSLLNQATEKIQEAVRSSSLTLSMAYKITLARVRAEKYWGRRRPRRNKACRAS